VSCNKYLPHLFVLPEDDADRVLANGFHVEIGSIRQMQVLPPAGGCNEVLRRFEADHVMDMDRFPHRFIVLLIDFDGREDRIEVAKAAVPGHLADRVFVLGTWTETRSAQSRPRLAL